MKLRMTVHLLQRRKARGNSNFQNIFTISLLHLMPYAFKLSSLLHKSFVIKADDSDNLVNVNLDAI